MRRVIHTGQALVDATAQVTHLPAQGQNVMAATWGQAAGGAVNILVAAARSGAVCVHAGAIGTGPNADLVRRALTQEGVVASADPVPGVDTALCVVLVEPSAERTFITMQGAERLLTREALDSARAEPGDLICVTGYSLAVESTRSPLQGWLSDLPDAIAVVLDPGAAFAGLAPKVRSAMLARTTVWTSNLEEAQSLVGPVTMAEAASLISQLLPDGAVAIVRDGQHGCAVHTDGATTVVPGFPQKAVDTNGAGDAHTGVLAAERVRGADWITACRRANIAGAIKVTRHGPAAAPTNAEIDAFEAQL